MSLNFTIPFIVFFVISVSKSNVIDNHHGKCLEIKSHLIQCFKITDYKSFILNLLCTKSFAGNQNRKGMDRRIPVDPTDSMEINEVAIFRRRTTSHCKLVSLYYTVIKTGGKFFGRDSFIFYAIGRDVSTGGSFDEVVEELAVVNDTHKYKQQIAFIMCYHGVIDALEVFDRSLGDEGPFEDPKRCGIGIVLTELCLIDPQVNDPKEGNRAFDWLNDQPTMLNFVKETCQKFVGLTMTAETRGSYPRSGGKTYLTAAINMRVDRILIYTDFCDPGEPDPNPVKIYEPKVAKDNYDPETGSINPCGGFERCDAFFQSWFFCSFTKGTKRKLTP